MKVMSGYKHTEVGLIPDEWEVAPLGNYATFRTGPFGSALHKSDYTTDGVPVVNPMHILNGKIEPTRTMTITEQVANDLSNFRLSPGEIVIGRRGDMGRCAVVQEHHTGWLCGTGSMIIRPTKIDADFLCRVLSSSHAISAIEDSSVGTTMINLNQGILSGLKIQFPTLSEQRAIAKALSDVDALLDSLDRLIAKKRDLKQAAMQQLLTGQTRLPGFSGEWEVKRVDEVGTCFAGGTPSTTRTDYWGRGVYWLPSGRVQNNILQAPSDSESSITQRGLNESAAKLIKPQSVLLAITGATCANAALLQFAAAANQSVVAIEPSEGYDPRFLYYSLLLERSQILSLQSGSAQGGVNLKIVKGLEIRFPTLSEQTSIANIISDMDAELAVAKDRRDKTAALKQGLMQELLTGRTRLV
jgi:type I restriction enzyme S subunit